MSLKNIINNSIKLLQENQKELEKVYLEQQIIKFDEILKLFKKRLKYIEEELGKRVENKDENTRQINDKKENISKLISRFDTDKEFSSKFTKLSESISQTEISSISQVETLLKLVIKETIKNQIEVNQKEFKLFEEKQNKYIKTQIKKFTDLKQNFENVCEHIKNQIQNSGNDILNINKNKINKIKEKINHSFQQATENLVESNSVVDCFNSTFEETKNYLNGLDFLTNEKYWTQHSQKISDCKTSVEPIQTCISEFFDSLVKKANKNDKKLEECNTTLKEYTKLLSKIEKNISKLESSLSTSKKRASSQDKNS